MGYCGLVCETCPIYLATRKENRSEQAMLRVEIARLCREQYGLAYQAEDITDCDGCLGEESQLFPPSRNCAIRSCAKEKGLENCAYCSDYTCEQLETFFTTEPTARERLEKLRRARKSS